MPRSVADATRFTPTGPVAGTAETPQQRVARLREAAKKAKAEKMAGSFMDQLVDKGRLWADRAHRITAIGLIGATFVCGAITVYAFTDMAIYNSKRKAERKQKMLEEAALNPPVNFAADAATATADTATATAAVAGIAEPRPSAWERVKSWGLSGMTPADQEYKNAFEKARETEQAEAEKLMAPIIVQATKEGRDHGDRIDRLGADDLVKGEKAKGGSVGVMSSVTGWWSGR
ncbi:Similar to hypothetical protein [Tuber melanosporum Mel28]; acc. no. XP_002836496 [Pyronema omphalodes CBS 100304]|uniref:Uncharacterized protein n=1 Tax=Pyronema omphalodes (strain CBS 100304) TaxID=1076935 RepID=U4L0U2_PYROM|nr:Similar to hypothetical protein [Tuber melanosporum Mel28]; acc. no. XP_002836496 [Pyronema omphalodes CBS 100304]